MTSRDTGGLTLAPLPTYTFDGLSVPSVSLTVEPYFRAVITVLGLSPQRTLTAEERLGGIESLSPPTVSAKTVPELLELGVRAVLASVEASGTEVTPDMLAVVSYSVSHSLRSALLLAGVDA
jgi:hypothetical protein